MSRPKKVTFTDALAVWAETASEQEIRDGVVMLSIYARQRKMAFSIRIESTKPGTQIQLKEDNDGR